jgi:hypothetical protein
MISRNDQQVVKEAIIAGTIDAAIATEANLVDEILLTMKRNGVIDGLSKHIKDHRERRAIPFEMVLTLAFAAKMKLASSLTDVPFAVRSAKTLAELGYCMWDTERDLSKGLMDEGCIRALVGKYEADEWIAGYNDYVQKHVLQTMKMEANIHILDATKIEVNPKNDKYEGAEVIKDCDGTYQRGYKLACLRGVIGDRGIIEEIRFGGLKTHDLKLSEEMIRTSSVLKPGDILMMDRGFIDRELINDLKSVRGVDVYIPLRKGMSAYNEAVKIAREQNQWLSHPNSKRKGQKIAQVENLGMFYESASPEKDVDLTGCVVWDKDKDEYYVFVTTAIGVSARRLISTYELRPEIEEDYRQIKDLWNIEAFRSKKLPVIAFHIMAVLVGYLYFQLFAGTLQGVRWAGKSLPAALKKYNDVEAVNVIICVGQSYAVYSLLKIMQLYASLGSDVRARLDVVLALA